MYQVIHMEIHLKPHKLVVWGVWLNLVVLNLDDQMIILVGMTLTLILYISTFSMGDCGVELSFVI
jgi:hypothetical protein